MNLNPFPYFTSLTFNDHLIAMPYSLSLHDSSFDEIYQQANTSFDTFFTTLTSNASGGVSIKLNETELTIFFKANQNNTAMASMRRWTFSPLVI